MIPVVDPYAQVVIMRDGVRSSVRTPAEWRALAASGHIRPDDVFYRTDGGMFLRLGRADSQPWLLHSAAEVVCAGSMTTHPASERRHRSSQKFGYGEWAVGVATVVCGLAIGTLPAVVKYSHANSQADLARSEVHRLQEAIVDATTLVESLSELHGSDFAEIEDAERRIESLREEARQNIEGLASDIRLAETISACEDRVRQARAIPVERDPGAAMKELARLEYIASEISRARYSEIIQLAERDQAAWRERETARMEVLSQSERSLKEARDAERRIPLRREAQRNIQLGIERLTETSSRLSAQAKPLLTAQGDLANLARQSGIAEYEFEGASDAASQARSRAGTAAMIALGISGALIFPAIRLFQYTKDRLAT